MHFTTLFAASAAVTGALAGQYYESSYTTVDDKVYTSVKTCTEGKTTTSAPYYAPSTTEPAKYPVSEVTYTSYEKITVTSCGDYVKSCPAKTYTSTAYSVSSCTKGYPTDVPYPSYVPPSNSTGYYVPPAEYPTTTHAVEYPHETPATETHTYYTTVCPGGKDYCYATTVTSTFCPGKPTETAVTYSVDKPIETPVTYSVDKPIETPVTYSVDKPVETPYKPATLTYSVDKPSLTPVPGCNGYNCPKNATQTYAPPPHYTGAASANGVSFGAAAVAGFAALFFSF